VRSVHDRLFLAIAVVILVGFSGWCIRSVQTVDQLTRQQTTLSQDLRQLRADAEVLQTHHPHEPAVLSALSRMEGFASDEGHERLEESARALRESLEVPGERDNARVEVVRAVADTEEELWVRHKRLGEKMSHGWFSLYAVAVAAILFAGIVVALAVLVRRRDLELVEALGTAEAASRAKSDFLATVSHEIRTPMTAILGTTELMGLSTLNPDQHEHLRVVRDGSQALLCLVDEVLDISRIEAGHLELREDDVDLDALLDGLAQLFHEASQAKGVALSVMTSADVPARIQADGSRLRQVLVNLVGNAVKFTDAGEVCVRVRYSKGCLQVEVADTGPGIPESSRERIFEAFEQAGERRTFSRRGTGLGLAITRRLVQAMGGTIAVQSEEGVGSRFCFDVRAPARCPSSRPPVDEAAVLGSGVQRERVLEQLAWWGVAHAPGAETVIHPAAIQPLRPGKLRRVLEGQALQDLPEVTAELSTALFVAVVDDQPDNREVIGSMLEALGCRVQLLASGHEVLAQVSDWDMVLMDVDMPGLDGLEATRALRRRGVGTPVLGLSGHATPAARERSLAAGMDDYITKPVGLVRLSEMLKQWG